MHTSTGSSGAYAQYLPFCPSKREIGMQESIIH